MPALAFPLFGLALGLGLAWTAASAHGRQVRAQGLSATGLFGLLLVGPAAGWLILGYPDWAFGYRFANLPLVLALVAIVASAAGVPAGFLVGGRVSLGVWRRWLPWLGAGAGALGLLVALVPHAAPFRLATTPQVRGGFAMTSVFASDLGLSLAWLSAFVGLGAWAVRRDQLGEQEVEPSKPARPAPASPGYAAGGGPQAGGRDRPAWLRGVGPRGPR